MKLLHIDSGILGEHSVSRRLTAAIVARLAAEHPDLQVTYRDLAADPISHLTGAVLTTAPEARSAALRRDVAEGAQALEEFLAADIVVIGAPMYNFTVPSQLKAWIDRVSVAGRTFRYTANGPEGLAGGKRVIVASTRGNFYAEGTPLAAIDHQETYLRAILAFWGVSDVEFVRAEGLNISPETRQAAIAVAEGQIAGQPLPIGLAA